MRTIKCDHCRKVKRPNLKNDKWVRFSIYGPEIYDNFDLCDRCAPQLVNRFKEYLKIKEKVNKIKIDKKF